MSRAAVWISLVLVLLAACASPKAQPAKKLTERQRDSILATEPLPGASVVGGALKASDSEAARAAKMDSLP